MLMAIAADKKFLKNERYKAANDESLPLSFGNDPEGIVHDTDHQDLVTK
jgi:hypothetical protein